MTSGSPTSPIVLTLKLPLRNGQLQGPPRSYREFTVLFLPALTGTRSPTKALLLKMSSFPGREPNGKESDPSAADFILAILGRFCLTETDPWDGNTQRAEGVPSC